MMTTMMIDTTIKRRRRTDSSRKSSVSSRINYRVRLAPRHKRRATHMERHGAVCHS